MFTCVWLNSSAIFIFFTVSLFYFNILFVYHIHIIFLLSLSFNTSLSFSGFVNFPIYPLFQSLVSNCLLSPFLPFHPMTFHSFIHTFIICLSLPVYVSLVALFPNEYFLPLLLLPSLIWINTNKCFQKGIKIKQLFLWILLTLRGNTKLLKKHEVRLRKKKKQRTTTKEEQEAAVCCNSGVLESNYHYTCCCLLLWIKKKELKRGKKSIQRCNIFFSCNCKKPKLSGVECLGLSIIFLLVFTFLLWLYFDFMTFFLFQHSFSFSTQVSFN